MKIKLFAYISLIIACSILIIYLVMLTVNGYVFNFSSPFSIDVGYKIAPFVSAFVGVFLTFASTLLIIENLNQTNKNNVENQLLIQKNQFEQIFFNLMAQQKQIKDSIIKSKVEFNQHKEVDPTIITENLFDNLALIITLEAEKQKVATRDELVTLYSKWYTIYNSELGHYFRHLFHIINFVDKNNYFELLDKQNFVQRYDYIKILRAQLSNSELVLLSLNALTAPGSPFKSLIEKYKLLKNLNLEKEMPKEFLKRVPVPNLIVEQYGHIEE